MIRPEEIMTTVLTALTGLTTTGVNAFRGRVYALEEGEVPALTIYMGPDEPLGADGPNNFTTLDSDLIVRVTAHVKSATTQTDTLLNLIRGEVHAALMADVTQGLSYVYTTIPLGTDEPDVSGEGDQPTASMDINWLFRYRSAVSTLEV